MNSAEMPKYVSHKTVHALEIAAITREAGIEGRRLSIADPGFADIFAPEGMFSRYQPVPGDFYVVYADEYKSFSPRKAFLEGYTREKGQ